MKQAGKALRGFSCIAEGVFGEGSGRGIETAVRCRSRRSVSCYRNEEEEERDDYQNIGKVEDAGPVRAKTDVDKIGHGASLDETIEGIACPAAQEHGRSKNFTGPLSAGSSDIHTYSDQGT